MRRRFISAPYVLPLALGAFFSAGVAMIAWMAHAQHEKRASLGPQYVLTAPDGTALWRVWDRGRYVYFSGQKRDTP
jgi:hypothetical protein